MADDAPLLAAWIADMGAERAPFIIPGHKGRTDLVGSVVAGDAQPGPLDVPNHLTFQVLGDAERLAARLWGADVCRFGVNGSTGSNHAAVMAVAGPGETVIVSRTLHKSVLAGLVYAGVQPAWIRPDIDPETGLPGPVPLRTVEEALAAHPEARAVLIGDPSYVGTISDTASIAEACHRRGVPLVVDAAWSAHFGFHPDLPPHAVAAGADIVVTSAHKALPAYSQASMIFLRSDLVDADRFDKVFDTTQSTSPAGAIVASIDAARAFLARHGQARLGETIAGVAEARARLLRGGLGVLDGPDVDPAKLVVLLAQAGVDGVAVARDLFAERRIEFETSTADMLIAMTTLADGREGIIELADRILEVAARHQGVPREPSQASSFSVEPRVILTPREAFFAATQTLPLAEAVGRVCAEMVVPYPPGIPVLSPGEEVTSGAVEAVLAMRDRGVAIRYCADPTMRTVKVVAY